MQMAFTVLTISEGHFWDILAFRMSKARALPGAAHSGLTGRREAWFTDLETDLSWLSNKATYVDPNGAITNFYPSETNRLNDLGTVRGRFGLAVDRTLLYLTAGLAYGDVANTALYNSAKFPTSNTPYFNIDSMRIGWVAGSGLEYALAPNWTVKGEAIYAQLNTTTATWRLQVLRPFRQMRFINVRFNTSVAVVRVGLNYKFY